MGDVSGSCSMPTSNVPQAQINNEQTATRINRKNTCRFMAVSQVLPAIKFDRPIFSLLVCCCATMAKLSPFGHNVSSIGNIARRATLSDGQPDGHDGALIDAAAQIDLPVVALDDGAHQRQAQAAARHAASRSAAI